MADVLPFRGWRYDPEQVGDMANIVAPPYDVISEPERQAFLAKHPCNVVRLDLGVDPLGPPPVQSRYELAAADLREWRREGIVVQEQRPAFYVYEQVYFPPSPIRRDDAEPIRRRGFVGLVKLEDYEDRIVLPHEGTLRAPKEDRLRLMQASEFSLSQIFSIYSDPEMTLERASEELCAGPPLWEVTDAEGVIHRMWVMDDAEACAQITAMFEERPLVIADGHHRYETALAYRNQQREKQDDIPHAPWEYVSMFMCNMDAGSLTILPCHRLLKELPLEAEATLWRNVMDIFDTERVVFDSSSDESRVAGIHGLLGRLAEAGPDEHIFALYSGGNYALLLHLRDMDRAIAHGVDQLNPATRELDVALLHKLVIEGVMGLTGDLAATGVNVAYSRDGHDAANRVARGEAAMVLYINTTRVEQVMQVALAGEHMPQKGTYFYPKVLSGLVFHDLRLDA